VATTHSAVTRRAWVPKPTRGRLLVRRAVLASYLRRYPERELRYALIPVGGTRIFKSFGVRSRPGLKLGERVVGRVRSCCKKSGCRLSPATNRCR
jgi:hypothetical protein